MSADAADPEPVDGAQLARRMREAAPGEAFLRSSSKNTSRRLHMPDPDDPDRHLCAHHDGADYGDVRAVDLAAFPPGYYPWCVRCAVEAFEDVALRAVDGPIEHPGVAADGGEGE